MCGEVFLWGVWEVSFTVFLVFCLRFYLWGLAQGELRMAKLIENSPIMSLAEIFPKMVIVKMGMFPRIPQPECESFALHRHDWQGKHGDMTQYEIARGGKKLGE